MQEEEEEEENEVVVDEEAAATTEDAARRGKDLIISVGTKASYYLQACLEMGECMYV